MQWGIEFDIKATDRPLLTHFPEPTIINRFTTITGPSDNIRVVYLLEYAPQSWKEMQRLAGIKVQMAKLLPNITFTPLMEYDSDDIEHMGSKWKLSELGKLFNNFIKFPTPLYPQDKSEFMSSLTKYAMRLHYEHRLYFELVLAMAIRFNKCLKMSYSHRDLQAKAISILNLDRSEWKRKLSGKALKEAHSKGGQKRGAKIAKQAYYSYKTVVALLPEYKKKNGKYDIPALMEFTELGRRTIYNYISRAKTTASL